MADQIQSNFEDFHAQNPKVYAMFHRFARQLLDAGYKRGSSSLIFERIRWETMFRSAEPGPVKINNNYRSRYSRLWEQQNPDHAGFFAKRQLTEETIDSTARAEESEYT